MACIAFFFWICNFDLEKCILLWYIIIGTFRFLSSAIHKENFMKKALLMVLAVALAFAAFGCKSNSAPRVSDPNMPPWMNESPPEDVIWGIGVSENQQIQMRMTMADARARQDISRQLNTLVQGMVTDYAREAGGINNSAAMQFAESVSRQVTQSQLQGAIRDVSWTTPDGRILWTRLKMSKADAASVVKAAVDSEAARYAEFKAMDALRMMDMQLEKNPTSPIPVFE